MVKAVLFDVDGTLTDSVDIHAEAWHRTLEQFGFHIPYAEVRSQIGKGADQLLPALLPQDVVKEKSMQIVDARQKLFKAEYMDRIRPFPQVRPLFERIRADGKQIALASSAKSDELDVYIKLLNIGDLIDAGTTSDDAEKSKPHPDIFHAALKDLGNPPAEETVVIGDTPYDGEAGKKAGCRFIGVLCGGFPREELCKAGAEEIYRDPEDLLRRYSESLLAESS